MDRAPYTVSRNGVLFIANREALVLTAYSDGPHCSVGFGSNSPALRVGDRITVKDAFVLLKRDIAEREKILGRALKVDLSQQQRDALASFYYQNGQKPIRAGAARLRPHGEPVQRRQVRRGRRLLPRMRPQLCR
jgi:GH24 family phage-related lysozyme (muramidase)